MDNPENEAQRPIRRAIQGMVARARLEHGRALRDFDIILDPEMYGLLVQQVSKEFERDVSTDGFVILNTANGATKVFCRGAR